MSTSSIDQIYERLSKDDIDGAVALARRAYLNDELEPIVLNLVAHGLETEGDLEGALRVLGEAVARAPDDAMTYTNVGHCLVKLARPTHALEAFNRALAVNPKLARAHHGAGLALWMRGDYAAGDEAQWRALAIDPNYPDPYGALAVAHAQRGEHARSQELAAKALSLNPNEIQALLLEGDRLYTQGRVEESVALQQRLLADPSVPPLQRGIMYRKLGNGLDRLKRFPEAFEAYTASKACEQRVYKDLFEADDLERQPDKLSRLAAYFRTIPTLQPTAPHDAEKRGTREHVFLMSFPRSGTTLLEQVLASHPDIVALEEQPTLRESIAAYFKHSDDIPKLMTASEEELKPWRDLYWQKVDGYMGDVTGKVFVDKQPALTPNLPLVKRLFPNAKILFNIRDPRDVVLSCFRHGFTMTTNMYEYTDINRLSILYCRTMECAEVYFEKLGLSLYRHQHEAFVEDFETHTQRLCEFLGVKYVNSLSDFVQTARSREINTPSRDQVREGLSTRGLAYWRNYADQMAEPIRILAPWVKAYGYED